MTAAATVCRFGGDDRIIDSDAVGFASTSLICDFSPGKRDRRMCDRDDGTNMLADANGNLPVVDGAAAAAADEFCGAAAAGGNLMADIV